MSYLPLETPPLVISKSNFFCVLYFFKNSLWLSLDSSILISSPPNSSTKCLIKILLVDSTSGDSFLFLINSSPVQITNILGFLKLLTF